MKRTVLTLVLLPLLSGSFQQGPSTVAAVNFDIVQLGEGIYACINKFGGKAICNAGIIDNGEATIIFDTFLSPDAADEMIRMVDRLSLSPIRYVVNSHYHNDHVRGNQCFPPGVKILSTTRTAALIEIEEPKSIAAEKRYGPVRYRHFDSLFTAYHGDTTSPQYRILKLWKAYYGELAESDKKIQTVVPTTCVEKVTFLDGSRRKVRLLDQGQGHTESDLVLYLPDDSTLFTGDLVFNKCHPYLGDGSATGLKSILAGLESMPVKIVVPGHGEVGPWESIGAMREYIEALEAIVRKIKKEGAGREGLRKTPIPGSCADWLLEEYYWANVEFVYDTIK